MGARASLDESSRANSWIFENDAMLLAATDISSYFIVLTRIVEV
jgi:hypothetical protein